MISSRRIRTSPAFILTLLNIHIFPDADLSSETSQECIKIYLREKLIETAPKEPKTTAPMSRTLMKLMKYRLTARGEAFVAMLCDTPLPVVRQVFADPRTEKQVGSFAVERSGAGVAAAPLIDDDDEDEDGDD